jgi:nucleoside-triphosphatase THEP1
MPTWSAIVGAPGTEKGTAARKLATLLEARGLRVRGFVQEDVSDAAGEALGWDIASVVGPEQRGELARVSESPDLCGYAFAAAGFAFAESLALGPADVVIVGNIGKLEAAKQGHWPLLERLIDAGEAHHVVACIRDNCLSAVALALPDPIDHVSLPCEDQELERLADSLRAALRG